MNNISSILGFFIMLILVSLLVYGFLLMFCPFNSSVSKMVGSFFKSFFLITENRKLYLFINYFKTKKFLKKIEINISLYDNKKYNSENSYIIIKSKDKDIKVNFRVSPSIDYITFDNNFSNNLYDYEKYPLQDLILKKCRKIVKDFNKEAEKEYEIITKKEKIESRNKFGL